MSVSSSENANCMLRTREAVESSDIANMCLDLKVLSLTRWVIFGKRLCLQNEMNYSDLARLL